MKDCGKLTFVDEKCAFDDGAMYLVTFKEFFGNGKYRIRTIKRHAFNLNQAFDNFIIEIDNKGLECQVIRICQAYESRRYFYND